MEELSFKRDQFKPITITRPAPKKGKQVSRSINAVCINDPIDATHRYFALEKTKRDLDRWRFKLEPGCIITDDSGQYVCESFSTLNWPKNIVIQAKCVS